MSHRRDSPAPMRLSDIKRPPSPPPTQGKPCPWPSIGIPSSRGPQTTAGIGCRVSAARLVSKMALSNSSCCMPWLPRSSFPDRGRWNLHRQAHLSTRLYQLNTIFRALSQSRGSRCDLPGRKLVRHGWDGAAHPVGCALSRQCIRLGIWKNDLEGWSLFNLRCHRHQCRAFRGSSLICDKWLLPNCVALVALPNFFLRRRFQTARRLNEKRSLVIGLAEDHKVDRIGFNLTTAKACVASTQLSLSLLRGTLRLMSTKDQNAPSQRRLAGLLDGEGATAPRSWATLAHNSPLMKRIINAVPHLWRHT
jgi:hypothetical protein